MCKGSGSAIGMGGYINNEPDLRHMVQKMWLLYPASLHYASDDGEPKRTSTRLGLGRLDDVRVTGVGDGKARDLVELTASGTEVVVVA